MKKLKFLISLLMLSLSLFSQTEICNNSIDDDNDGYIDLFDPDCPCSDSTYQAYCPVNCEYIPDSFPEFKMKLKWKTEILSDSNFIFPNIVVGDIDNDKFIEIISSNSTGEIIKRNSVNGISIFDGNTGALKNKFNYTGDTAWSVSSYITIADINNDNFSEIFIFNYDDNTVLCYDYGGNFIWKSKILKLKENKILNIADFNGDGISEIYFGNAIYNSLTGNLIVQGNKGIGGNKFNPALFDIYTDMHSVAADLLPNNPGLELAAGNTVYKVNIVNVMDSIGNTISPIIADTIVKDGFTSVADIDGDGKLDIVVVRSNTYSDGGGIWIWNPRKQKIIAKADAGIAGGIAFIGNVDDDCTPEIGIAFAFELKMYKYNGTSNLQLLYSLPTTDESGVTGITMFDFNQDGKNELVYRDETDLRILEGSTGKTISSYPVNSGTGLESPIIADIDNDGQAEIVVNGYIEDKHKLQLFAFESAGAPWAPARSVWNQTAYNVTNINDDLTIPRHPQNTATFISGSDSCSQATCPQVYNSFMAQATYRTQQGCVQWPSLDLQPELLDWTCSPDSVTLSFVIHNQSDGLAANDTFGLRIYDSNPFDNVASEILYKDLFLNIPKESTSDTLSVTIPKATGYIYIVVNTKKDATTPLEIPLSSIAECDYLNNVDSVEINIEELKLNIGDDIQRCETGVVTFHVSGDFSTYLWSDGSTDSTFTTSEDGIYYLETTDKCGRIYRDTVEVTSYSIEKPQIDGNIYELCAGDSLEFKVLGDYDEVNWFPPELVDCHTCTSINVSSDEPFLLIVQGEKDGCFNSDTVQIYVKTPVEVDVSISICRGDSVEFFDKILYNSGTYQHTINVCDSIYTLNLEVIEPKVVDLSESICAGDSIYVGGKWWNSSGLHTIDLTSKAGCDSTINLDLKVIDLIENTEYFTLCPQDSVRIGGKWIKESGQYIYKLIAQSGCDSLYIANVEKLVAPNGPELEIDCDKPKVNARIIKVGAWNIQWSNGDTTSITNYQGGEDANVLLKAEPDCQLKYDFHVPELPDLSQLPYFADTLINPLSTISLQLDLNSDEWQVEWSPIEIIDCPSCMGVEINATENVEITIKLTHSSGCIYTKTFTINIDFNEDIYVPNIFSPDGDGFNDTWYITFKDYHPMIIEAAIFDRWGEKVAEWHNVPNVNWDGIFKGKKVNTGVFVYYFKYKGRDGKEVIVKGDVTVL